MFKAYEDDASGHKLIYNSGLSQNSLDIFLRYDFKV